LRRSRVDRTHRFNQRGYRLLGVGDATTRVDADGAKRRAGGEAPGRRLLGDRGECFKDRMTQTTTGVALVAVK